MTAVILVGLMVALALIVAITWIEPRILGGPVTASPGGASDTSARPVEPVRDIDGGPEVRADAGRDPRTDVRARARSDSRPAPRAKPGQSTRSADSAQSRSRHAA